MERVNQICRHPLWTESVDKIRELERDRIFCKHDVAHCLDVARIAYIENLERGLEIPKERIYAAALLHDIGRHLQYLEGIPPAILQHRTQETKTKADLAGLLYRADKASRSCLFCQAQKACNWSQEKKNLTLKG